MAATSTSLSSPPPLTSIFKPKPPLPPLHFLNTQNSSSSLQFTSSKRTLLFQNPPQAILQKLTHTHLWRISASTTSEDILVPSDTTSPIENAQQIVSTTPDDGVSTIISVLLFIAFVGLTILSIGVVYIAVTDYLQKRETEKFQKAEAAKKKKGGKKMKVTRAGPKGFGQKIVEDDDYGDD